ncbi:MAG: hypothetical protein ACI9TH_002973 [Kiritimatiellia bacterium]
MSTRKICYNLLCLSIGLGCIRVYERASKWADQTFRFKVGAYLQDREGPVTEGGRVAFSQLKVSHGTATAADNPEKNQL